MFDAIEEEQKITFTQIEHHTMERTKKKKQSPAKSSMMIDRLVQFNEIWNRAKKTKPSDTRRKSSCFRFIFSFLIQVQMNIVEQHSPGE